MRRFFRRCKSRVRRGANAVEFALLMPVAMGLAMGVFDYSWFFFQESLIVGGLRESARTASMQLADVEDAPGDCTPCIATAQSRAISELDEMGITLLESDLNAHMEAISGTCAVVIEPTIPFTPLFGFLNDVLTVLPDEFHVRVVSLAINVEGCE